MATPQVGIVHQIVVQQRIVVVGLQTGGLHEDSLRVVLEEVVGQQHERGTNALATQREHIVDGVVEVVGLTVAMQTRQGVVYFLKELVGWIYHLSHVFVQVCCILQGSPTTAE
jgi:hypothetical protein